jgi:hypothetical protein
MLLICCGKDISMSSSSSGPSESHVDFDATDQPNEQHQLPPVCSHTAVSMCTTMTRVHVAITLCIYQVPRSSFLSPRSDMTATCQEQSLSPYIQQLLRGSLGRRSKRRARVPCVRDKSLTLELPQLLRYITLSAQHLNAPLPQIVGHSIPW